MMDMKLVNREIDVREKIYLLQGHIEDLKENANTLNTMTRDQSVISAANTKKVLIDHLDYMEAILERIKEQRRLISIHYKGGTNP